MGCTTQSSTFRLGAANVSWGKKHKTCYSIDSSALVGGEYAEVSNGTVDYYVWYNVDGGDIDPSIAGKTAVVAALTSPYSDADIIAATKLALEAVGGLDSFFVGGSDEDSCMCIERSKVGAPLSASTAGNTGWTFEETVSGVGGDLGATEGGVEAAFEITTVDIMADQTGEGLRDKIITGTKATVTMSLLEMTEENWCLIVGETTGDKFTPSGGTEVVGYGESRNYASLFDLSGELNLNPVANGSGDRSEDLTFWKCAPIPDSYNFSGTETSKMSVTFEALVDRSKDSKVNLFAYGDPCQDFRA